MNVDHPGAKNEKSSVCAEVGVYHHVISVSVD